MPVSDNAVLVTAISRLAELLPVGGDSSGMVRQLMRSATDVLDLAGCTVMLVSDELRAPDAGARLATAEPEALVDIELCQHRSERGPSMDAFRTGETVAVADIDRRRAHWPEFSARPRSVRSACTVRRRGTGPTTIFRWVNCWPAWRPGISSTRVCCAASGG
jgi:hypothetical protein